MALQDAPANRGSDGQIRPVQILRAVAALMVVMHHAQYEAALLAARTGTPFARNEWLPWMAGVDIFFVISGFIMVHASRRLFGRAGAAATFLKRRLWRIVPLYWLMTTLFLAVGLLKADALNSLPAGWGEIIAAYLFWPVRRADGNIQPVFSLGWTLNYEMLFYFLFAAALLLRRAAAPTALSVTIALVTLIAAAALLPGPLPLAFWGQPIVLEFALGMAIGLMRAGGWQLSPAPRALMLLAGIGLLALAAAARPAPLAMLALSGLAAALMVAGAALGPAPGPAAAAPGPAAHRPASPPLRWASDLGDASYALYLSHPFVLRAGGVAAAKSGLAGSGLALSGLFVPALILAACLAALGLHRWFEKPVARLAGR